MIVEYYRRKKYMHQGKESNENERVLLLWCRQCTQRYKEVNIQNFTTSWKDGLAFNALLNFHRPDLFDYQKLVGQSPKENLQHAFQKAQELGVPQLLDVDDVLSEIVDKKCVLMYITSLYEVLIKQKYENDEADGQHTTRSDSPTPSSVSTMSEWDDFNETLQQVLTWLQQAETQLKNQENVSGNVDKVKEQFREHEDFMMILTSHQASVGSVLEFGSQLINENIVVGKEEKDIREQMTILSERWENLRVSAMQRQADLHQHLMKLQQLQLKELGDWLTKAEAKMKSADRIGSDIDVVKRQVEEHKLMQEDLENQQQQVNSLSHMVVVVDEAESEDATADLEEQLGILGERWSLVCKWTESRWNSLQEVLKSWQEYRNEEQRLNEWLSEKEKALKEISDVDMGDKKEVQLQIQKLKSLEIELTRQQASFGNFNNAAQTVAQTLEEDSPTIIKIQDTMEDFNNRWNKIASMLNTKMKHLRTMENKLQSFLKELEENLHWITDAQMLLKPQNNPQKELVESLHQAIAKRRVSITQLANTGKELMSQTLTAGQSGMGIQQSLLNFTNHWQSLQKVVNELRQEGEVSVIKKKVLVEIQKVLTIITEITTYVEKVSVQLAKDPKELFKVLETKLKELTTCSELLEKVSKECQSIADPALKSALNIEIEDAMQKFKTTKVFLEEKKKSVMVTMQSIPPQEFTDGISSIKTVLDEVFPFVSKEFKYSEAPELKMLAGNSEEKLKKLKQQESGLKFLFDHQNELLRSLNVEIAQKFRKEIGDLNRQWTDCVKITEARLQRVNEALLQTKELDVAMTETFNWMDDVDKFIEEIKSTIAEGDAETINSQVQEVEALQQDILTVQKKVDSLIETCIVIMNRGEEAYAAMLQSKLKTLRERWERITVNTENQKESLRNAGLKFQEVKAGIKALLQYLNTVENNLLNERLNTCDKNGLRLKIDAYEDIKQQLGFKSGIIKEYLELVNKLISTAPSGNETPAGVKELVQGSQMFAKVTAKVEDFLLNVKDTFSKVEKLENLISVVYKSMDVTDVAIDSAKLKLNEDNEKLEKCLLDLDNQYSYLSSDCFKDIDIVAKDIINHGTCSSFVTGMISDYESRLEDTRERSKKFRYIVEGELLKRRQLSDDIVQIDNWLQNTEMLVNERISGAVLLEEKFIENLQEQVSLNVALVSSAEGTIKELVLAGGHQNHIALENKFNAIKLRWSKLMESIKVLEQQPNINEMEKRFIVLEGSTLSDIDNLKRKIKKVKLASPEVPDIQLAVEALEQLSPMCTVIEDNISALQNIAADISTKANKNVDPQVDQVRKEYENVKNLLKVQEIIFGDALPLSEIIYANFESINDWLRSLQDNLNVLSKEHLPEFPDDLIQSIQAMITELNDKAQDVQQLNNNTVQLGKMSEAESFRLLEARVHEVYNNYMSAKQETKGMYDLLIKQRDQVNEYKEVAKELNDWIDSRRSTLQAIGGVSNKFDIEMELMKLKGIKSIVDAKESELDSFKMRGDDIATICNSKLVSACENEIFKRWNELEDKIKYIQSTLEMKLKEIDRVDRIEKLEEAPPAKHRVIETKQIVVYEPMKTVQVQSCEFDLLKDGRDMDENISEHKLDKMDMCRIVSVKQPSFDRKVNLNKSIESLVADLDAIEESLFNMKSDENINHIQENVEKLDGQLFDLQPDFEILLEEANNKVGELENNTSILKLTRKLSKIHVKLEMRRQSLRESDYKLNCINRDVEILQQWLVQTDQLLRDPQSDKLKGLELFEQRAAELDAVNIRVEQLSTVCSDNLIPKSDIAGLNKKFKMLSRHFEQYQRPEEKVTTYKISVETGNFPDADTRANVSIKLFGEYGNSDQLQLQKSETKRKKFQINQVDLFTFRNQPWLGKLSKLRVWHDNEGVLPAWYLQSIYILDELSGRLFCFVISSWLSKDKGAVLKEAPVNFVALYKESVPDVLTKKHRQTDVHWLFECVTNTKPIKPYQEFVSDIKSIIANLEELHGKMRQDCFSGKPFDEYMKKEEIINEVTMAVNELYPVIASIMASSEQYLTEGSETNMQEIDISLTLMRSKWNFLNKDLKEKQCIFYDLQKKWKNLQSDLTEFLKFIGELENEFITCERTEKTYNTFEKAVQEKNVLFNSIMQAIEYVVANSSETNGKEFLEKRANLSMRWNQIKKQLSNMKLSLFSGDEHMKSVIKTLGVLERLLAQSKHILLNNKPHPLNEEDLEIHLKTVQNIKSTLDQRDHVDFITTLRLDADKLFSKDISPILLEEITAHSNHLLQEWSEVTTLLPNHITMVQEQLSKATFFLENLEELYDWVCSTRNLLEKSKQGNLTNHQLLKSIRDRQVNVDTINCSVEEYKTYQSTSRFPQDVIDKMKRLNEDWKVISTLATHSTDQTVNEEVLIEELLKENEAVITFDSEVLQEDKTNKFDKNVAELHDVLKLIEQKLKGFTLNVGDPDDIELAVQKHNAIQQEVNNRRGDLEDVIEMGAALTMYSKNESFNYATDDKITKLKERWDIVSKKIESQKAMFEQLNRDLRRCNLIITQVDNWIHKAGSQLNERLKVGSTVTELENQLSKHKVFQEELIAFSEQFNNVRKQTDDILQTYSSLDLTSFKGKCKEMMQAWSDLDTKSNIRQQSLQEALDNILVFHKNMIGALTWLSSAESKVAELDSLYEASQTEDNTDLEELQQEMLALEEDIALHQAMFQSLNDTGNQIMMDLEQGEVRTALQSKLDDMNDRWNSLGLRVVDIRDRMADGTGEWRQLLFDMQEIVDWLLRAGQELNSQQPVGSDISTIKHQHENHQAFKGKLLVRQVVIKQVLDQGRNFLMKHQMHELASREDNIVSSVQEQIEHIETQWQLLMSNSEKWQVTIDTVLELVNKLVKEIDDLNNRLKDAENRKNLWNPTSDFNCENVNKALEETKVFNDNVTSLEPYIDSINGKVKALKVSYGVDLGQKQKQVDEFLKRWSKLQSECEERHNTLNNILNNDQDKQSQLQGSVSPPWERSCSLNKVPYYINHTTKVTQWDHPKMTELYNTLAELNDVKFAAYRTSMKLRCIQKACCLDLVDMDNVAIKAFQRHDITANNDSLIDVGEMVAVLLTMFGNIDPTRKEAIVVPQCVDLTLNWLLNVFDSGRIGKLRVLSFKIAIVLLCRAKLENKWKYLFEQIADSSGHADSKKLGLLLHDCVQIPRQLGEIAAFGGSNIEPSARSCFEKAKNPTVIEVNNFLEWTSAEPQSLVWMTVLHRLAAAETAKHDAKCGICKDFPIVGFRYRCLKCFNYDLCQNCFWSGRVSKSHRLTHPMHQYSLATTAGEDMSDFVKLMKNKFKSRRYRSRPPKKLGYLPVQTIMEGSSIETPSVPSSPNIKFSYLSNDRSSSPESENYRMVDDINEEHRLIQHMCRSLSSEDSRLLPLKSPSAILASLDIEEKIDITQSVNDIISDLEEEHRALESEYNRLKNMRANGSNPRSSSDSELIAEAQLLRQHKVRLEARMQILEHHNKQLEAQLQRLRQLLEQPQSDRSVQSSAGVTPTLTPSSSYHGSPELGRRDYSFTNGYSLTNAMDIQQVTNQIENAFPMD
ncbi:utrophin-like isoform X2 [Hydra vulgaris]